MAVGRPLLTDSDPSDGMNKLFIPGKHFIPYESNYSNLEDQLRWALLYPEEAARYAIAAREEVRVNHTINNRVDQILEVLRAG